MKPGGPRSACASRLRFANVRLRTRRQRRAAAKARSTDHPDGRAPFRTARAVRTARRRVGSSPRGPDAAGTHALHKSRKRELQKERSAREASFPCCRDCTLDESAPPDSSSGGSPTHRPRMDILDGQGCASGPPMPRHLRRSASRHALQHRLAPRLDYRELARWKSRDGLSDRRGQVLSQAGAIPARRSVALPARRGETRSAPARVGSTAGIRATQACRNPLQ